jgi:hypothetical protein
MTQRMGVSGRDVPLETQFMLVEVPASGDGDDDAGPVYLVMLPLLEGQFRAALQGNERDELQICIESGDKAVQTDQGAHMVYLHAGDSPFDAITAAVKAVEKHLQTFHHRDRKKLPSFLDWFGWCTWDAFYTDVTADGVKHGLQRYTIHPLQLQDSSTLCSPPPPPNPPPLLLQPGQGRRAAAVPHHRRRLAADRRRGQARPQRRRPGGGAVRPVPFLLIHLNSDRGRRRDSQH